jgi:hypothetical protein
MVIHSLSTGYPQIRSYPQVIHSLSTDQKLSTGYPQLIHSLSTIRDQNQDKDPKKTRGIDKGPF